ncbi:MAG: DUF3152 domain-containing protein [Nocardioides sp.]
MGLAAVARGLVTLAVLAGLGTVPSAGAAEAIVSTGAPVVTGDPVYRERLSATAGTWSPEPTTLTYQWLSDGDPVAGAVGAAYRPDLDDLGHTLAVSVVATDLTGAQAVAVSAPTVPVARAELGVSEAPVAVGSPRFTRTLTARPPRLRPLGAEVSYRWLRDDRPIAGARVRTYRLAVEDVGHRVRVRATARRAGYVTTRLLSRPRTVLHLAPQRRTVTYHVETRGPVTADLAEFRRQAQETFDDPRGWRTTGTAFRQVRSGGDLTLVLAVASAVPGFSSSCSATWSCRVGRYVIINQTRWATASPAWNAAGRSLRDYRHLVVDHETGHWLGHGHRGCSGSGPAPVMMQQSKGTGGCGFNPWPLPSERWVRR